MKTITHKGKIYQVDESYLVKGKLVILRGYNKEDGFVFLDGTEQGLFVYASDDHPYLITTSKYTSGTIEDAPIELEAGQWYMCDLESGLAPLQRNEGLWYFSDGRTFNETKVDVIPLYKMVKAESQ